MKNSLLRALHTFFFLFVGLCALAQSNTVSGVVVDEAEKPLPFATVVVEGTTIGVISDKSGAFKLVDIPKGEVRISASFLGYSKESIDLSLGSNETIEHKFILKASVNSIDEVVVSGTLRPVKRMESPVPVEVYTPTFFKKNPTPNIYEALQNVNGVRPQLNCQVCNTGDIHINGLEGPYTMVLIDGMPIVSSLATVYGLSGIPNAMIERMEVVKGPASSLYGSEAIGGLINIITKNPETAPIFSADVMGNTWQALNVDLGGRFNIGKKASALTGVNFYLFDQIVDNNNDNFTDVALQERVSVFQKWNFKRKSNRIFTLAGRYYFEDRWGGELDWTPEFRGSGDIYGEAITTERWEALGQYQLPTSENIVASFSFNSHKQNSVYGDTPYIGDQRIGFGQMVWTKELKRHNILVGAATRYTYYDDNTPATADATNILLNNPDEIWLPGVFVQDEISMNEAHKVLLGFRYDYNDNHGNIYTPRLAYKWSLNKKNIFRLNAGTGFRVVNLFTEDHAALTGAREVIIAEELAPETSYNVNMNYINKMYGKNGNVASIELSAWYTHFDNVIFPDYETNANQIIYDNLNGHAVSQGVSINADLRTRF
ncbi:MAG: TonB-dependent receptor, partial [Bacteroidota bacterium]